MYKLDYCCYLEFTQYTAISLSWLTTDINPPGLNTFSTGFIHSQGSRVFPSNQSSVPKTKQPCRQSDVS